MFNELRDGMLRQITLIEIALGRKLADHELDHLAEIRTGLFYINPDEIVRLTKEGAEKVSFFLLDQEVQHDIFLNYGGEYEQA